MTPTAQGIIWVPLIASLVAVLIALGGILVAIGMKKQQLVYQEAFIQKLTEVMESLREEFHQHEVYSSGQQEKVSKLEEEIENLREWRHRLSNDIMGGIQKSVYELGIEVRNLKETVKELKEIQR